MTDPEVPKVLATQIDGKIRLTWQKPEPEGFWLEFEPVTNATTSSTTQQVVIPQDCNLHLTCDVTEGVLKNNLVWVTFPTDKWNEERYPHGYSTAPMTMAWYLNGDFGFYADEEMYLKIEGNIGPSGMPGYSTTCGGTITIRLDDENGPIVGQFDFLHGMGV